MYDSCLAGVWRDEEQGKVHAANDLCARCTKKGTCFTRMRTWCQRTPYTEGSFKSVTWLRYERCVTPSLSWTSLINNKQWRVIVLLVFQIRQADRHSEASLRENLYTAQVTPSKNLLCPCDLYFQRWARNRVMKTYVWGGDDWSWMSKEHLCCTDDHADQKRHRISCTRPML